MMAVKSERHLHLRVLLAERALRSQSAVHDALAERGVKTHPSTVGRDLEELGARKVRDADGQLVYRLDEADSSAGSQLVNALPSTGELDAVLAAFVHSVAHAGNIVVLRTPPACASPVASALDTSGGPSVLGTVAGDDTVLVVIADRHDVAEVAQDLRRRSAGATPPAKP